MKGTKKLKRILAVMAAVVTMTAMCSTTAIATTSTPGGTSLGVGDPIYVMGVNGVVKSPEYIDEEEHYYQGSRYPYLRIIEERTEHDYVKGSGVSVTITCNGEFSEFRNVYVDDVFLEKNNYTVKEGSTVLTLMPEYLETLSIGAHKVTLNYTYGSVDSVLNVIENNSDSGAVPDQPAPDQPAHNASAGDAVAPRTGDTSGIVLWSMAAMASGCVILIRRKRTDAR